MAPPNRCVRIFHTLGIPHILPILLLVAYSFLGAFMFSHIEGPYERLRANHNRDANPGIRKGLIRQLNDAHQWANPEDAERDAFEWFEDKMNCSSASVNGLKWDMWGGMFYAASIYTTIGYGNIAPVTTLGRILTIPYALFGIPLMIIIIRDLGVMFFKVLATTCRICTCRWRRRQKLMPIPGAIVAEMDEINLVPLILLLIAFLFVWTAIYLAWESGLGYLKAFYFVFLSFSTVGLGDVMPKGSKTMVWSYFPAIFALALLSMIYAAVQAKVEAAFNRIRNAIVLYYAQRLDQDPAHSEMLATSGTLHPNQPRLTITTVPQEVMKTVDTWDKLFYHLFMDSHRRRLLLERCRMYYRRRNARTQTGVLRKSSSEKRPIQFGGTERARTPQKTVNFQGVENRFETTPPRGRKTLELPSDEMYMMTPQRQQQMDQHPVMMAPAMRNPRHPGTMLSDPDALSTTSFTTALTTFPASSDPDIIYSNEQRRPTLASTSSDAMLNDFLFPEVNLVTRDPLTSKTLEKNPYVDAQQYFNGQ